MGGQMRNKRKFKLKKSQKKGRKVNDPKTFRNIHKRAVVFHSIFEDIEELKLQD